MMRKARARRHFDATFKLKVVRMIREEGLSVGQVCRDLDLTDSAVRNWVAKYDAEQRGEPVGGLPLSAEQRRIRELERENQQLKQDVALLKKASAFFAQEIR